MSKIKKVIIEFDLETKEDFENLCNSIDLIPCKFIKIPKNWDEEK